MVYSSQLHEILLPESTLRLSVAENPTWTRNQGNSLHQAKLHSRLKYGEPPKREKEEIDTD